MIMIMMMADAHLTGGSVRCLDRVSSRLGRGCTCVLAFLVSLVLAGGARSAVQLLDYGRDYIGHCLVDSHFYGMLEALLVEEREMGRGGRETHALVPPSVRRVVMTVLHDRSSVTMASIVCAALLACMQRVTVSYSAHWRLKGYGRHMPRFFVPCLPHPRWPVTDPLLAALALDTSKPNPCWSRSLLWRGPSLTPFNSLHSLNDI